MGSESTSCRYGPLPEGIEVREGKRKDSLRIRFWFQGERCGETLDIPVTAANIKYAERFRGEILNAIERKTFDYAKTFPNSKRARLTVAVKKRYKLNELVHEYIDNGRKTKSLSPSSIAGHQRWYNARIKDKWDLYVDEITTGDMRTWIVFLLGELQPKSVRNLVGLVSVALSIAMVDEKIERNPLAPIKLKTLLPKRRKKDDEKIDPFNLQEITAILDACPTIEDRCTWQFAFGSGSRPGELIAFKWAHTDWLQEKIRFQDNVVSGEIGTVEKDLKTVSSERDVPMLPAVRESLTAMRPISELQGGPVFLNPITGKRWANEHQLRNRWRIILRKAGVRYRNPYQTRHSFASHLLEGGEHELTVALLLGHTTPEMVRRTYGKYIRRPEGIKLRGDYSKFGADLGQGEQPKPALKSK
jgi:integrase